MKKYSKLMAVLLVVAMLLPGIAQAAPVAEENVVRLAGKGRIETSVEVSKEAYKDGANAVVLAGYNGEVDALAGTLLANAKKAPLLFTNKDKVSPAVKAEIARLGAKKAYILGGDKVVFDKVETELKGLGLTVKRVEGDNRAETAVAVAEEVGGATTDVFLARGYGDLRAVLADALAVGPASAKKDMPVLLTETGKVSPATLKALKDLGVKNITIVGGVGAVSAEVKTQLEADYKVDRIAGTNREKTAIAIADQFFAGSEKAIVANGYGSPDALVGGYLGAKAEAPILFSQANKINTDSIDYMVENTVFAYVLGGTGAINADVFAQVEKAVEGKEEEELKVESVSAINAKNEAQVLPATNVVANAKLQVEFSADVDALTVNTGTIYLTQNGVKQLATVSYNSDKKVATLELTAGTLDAGKEYVLTVDGVKNADKVAVSKSTTNFTVSVNPIITAATTVNTAAGIANIDGAVVNSTTPAIVLTLNKDVDLNTLNTSNIKLYNIAEEKYVSVTLSSISATGVTVTTSTLADEDYRLEVTSGIKDLAGNSLSATSYNFFYNIAVPTIGNISPTGSNVYNKITASGGNDAFKFRAQFSAAVDASTVNGNTVKLIDKVTGETVDANVTYEEGSRYVVVTPRADLKETTQYEVVIDGVKTARGIKIAKVTPSFTTGDFTAPTIVSSTPANAAEGVKVDGTITVNFSEKMNASTLVLGTDVLLVSVTDSNTPVTYTNFISSLSQDGKVLTIKPSAGNKLDVNKTYRLTIKKTVADVATNPLKEDYKVLFNTEVAAATVLESVQVGTVYATTNTKIESGVTTLTNTQNLFFNFDKALQANGINKVEDKVKVEELGSNGIYSNVPVKASTSTAGDVVVTLDNNSKSIKVTAPHTNNWIADKTYRVTVPTTVKDVNGNSVKEIVFTFTVGTKPAVDTANSSPANFATGVAVNTPYIAVVINDANSALQNATLNSDNVKIVKKADGTAAPYSIDAVNYAKKTTTATATTTSGDATLPVTATTDFKVGDIITVGDATGSYVVTAITAGTSVTLDKGIVTSSAGATKAVTFHQGVVYKLNTDAKLAGSTDYQVQVKDVLDAAGNKVDNTTIAFKTASDVAELEFVSSSVKDGATGVAVNTPVEITFNEEVTDATITNIKVLDVTNSNTDVTANFNVNKKAGNSKVVVIESKGFLKDVNNIYKVQLPNTLKSSNNAGTFVAKDITFQTETNASVKPEMVSAEYFDLGTAGVNKGDVIKLTFNVELTQTGKADAENDFTLGGLGTEAFSDATNDESITVSGKTITIVLGTNPVIVPGVSTIKAANNTGGDATWTDIMGNAVNAKNVIIIKK